MAYDDAARLIAIKAIGTVESSFDYTAINYNDPITVGVMQWYGTRAAALLNRIKAGGAGTNRVPDPSCQDLTKWRAGPGDTAVVDGDHITLTQGVAASTLYIDPLANYALTSDVTVTTRAEVSVNNPMSLRLWHAGYNGATATSTSPDRALTPQDGWVTLEHTSVISPSGATGTYYRSLIQARGTIPAGDSFNVRKMVVTESGAKTWVGVAASLEADLAARPATDRWWDDRYLTKAEGESLRPVLAANKVIQNAQAFEDLDVYRDAAVRAFIDPEGNTPMMLLYFVARHQSPARANRLIANIGADSSLERLYKALLNEEVFGRYRTRYTTAYDIIRTGDSSGVEMPPSTVVPSEPPGGNDTETPNPAVKTPGDVSYIRKVGDALHVRLSKGTTIVANPSQADYYTPSQDAGKGATVPPPTQEAPPTNPPVEVPPETPPGDAQAATRAALVKWMTDHIGQFSYAQAPGRREPLKSGFSDCSGTVGYAYRVVAGVDPGNSTRDQINTGTRITEGSGGVDESKLLPGDLMLINWKGGNATVDHVEMYIGGGQVCGHGGPGKGPTTKDLQRIAGRAQNWAFNRYV